MEFYGKPREFSAYLIALLLIPYLFWEGLGVFELGILPSMVFILTCIALSNLAACENVKVIQCSFWLFVYIFLILAPVSQQLAGYYPWLSSYDDYELLVSWGIVLSGCVAFFIPTVAGTKIRKNQICYQFSNEKIKYFLVFSIIVFIISLASIGGVGSLFIPRDELSAIFDGNVSQSMITQALLRIPVFIISLFYLHKISYSSNKKIRRKNIIFFFLLASVTLIINNPVSTPRFWVACIFLTYILYYLVIFNYRVNVIFLAMMLFLTIFVFPVSDAFRRSTDVSFADYLDSTNISQGFIVSANYDSFQQITNSVVYVENNGVSYGGRLASALFFWVPRSIMPFKHASSGEDLAVFSRYDFTNLSTPLWAEIYLDFGFFGVPIFFFLLGIFVVKYDYLNRSIPSIPILFIASYEIYFLRGTLLAVIGFFAVTLLFFYFLSVRRGVK